MSSLSTPNSAVTIKTIPDKLEVEVFHHADATSDGLCSSVPSSSGAPTTNATIKSTIEQKYPTFETLGRHYLNRTRMDFPQNLNSSKTQIIKCINLLVACVIREVNYDLFHKHLQFRRRV